MIARDIVEAVPKEAAVLAQSAFTNQLAHREHIYLYPWPEIPEEEIDYLILAEGFNAYPFSIPEIHWEILNTVADPEVVIEVEAEGIYLFHRGGAPLPYRPIGKIADGAIMLDKVEVATADERGFFRPKVEQPVPVAPGQEIRVTVYWQALAALNAERTVSMRIVSQEGGLLAQKDSQPSEASRPTSWWEPGWYFRDVYYLTLPAGTQSGAASLALVLYDSFNLERVLFKDRQDVLHLFDLKIVEPGARG